jgi:hypothetical protein
MTTKEKDMRAIRIKTTSWPHEDFFLVTTLEDDQIAEVIQPIVNLSRDGYEKYDRRILVQALKDRFPLEYIDGYFRFSIWQTQLKF